MIRILGNNYKIDLDKLIEVDFNDHHALLARSDIYHYLGKHQKVLRDLNQALSINPNHINALVVRGETHRVLGQYQQALEYAASFERDLCSPHSAVLHAGLPTVVATAT